MGSKTHIMVLPFPLQGHINPMLQFSKHLASRGLKVTLLTTLSTTIEPPQSDLIDTECIPFRFIEDGKEDIGAFIERFKETVSQNLPKIVEKCRINGTPVEVLVYDSLAHWALDISHQIGIKGASFFTQSCAVCAIYYHHHEGNLEIPSNGSLVSLPCLKPVVIGKYDLPSFIYDMGSFPPLLKLVIDQFLNFKEADWLLFNTFDKLEDKVVKWMANQWPIKTIGPAIPSKFLDKHLKEDHNYGLDLFKPDTEACINWLDTKPTGSVVYISFGSLATLGENNMEELAMGLMNSGAHFLWVVRSPEQSKLPSNFLTDTSERSLVVNWCPQLEVLAHQAVGCFVTHCGWNSTLESLSLGVPMVAMPQWTDQTTNAKYIVDVWEAGVRVKVGENGIASREEIEICIREVMEGERGIEIKRNALRWKELAIQAVDEGGSSDKNIDEFISELENTQCA
ncbi:hypothetical protein LguiA_002500 [Lonicera macranthoides]